MDRRRFTFARTYGAQNPLPLEPILRNVRMELEALVDLEGAYDLGDVRLTVRRSDWTVYAELDVWQDEPEPDATNLDEEF